MEGVEPRHTMALQLARGAERQGLVQPVPGREQQLPGLWPCLQPCQSLPLPARKCKHQERLELAQALSLPLTSVETATADTTAQR